MKVQHLKTNNKILLIVASILVVTLVGFGAVYAVSGSFFGWTPLGDTSNEKPTDEQAENGHEIKESSLEGQEGKSGSDQPITPTTDENGLSTVEVDIISVNRVDDTLKVSTLISALDQSGTCVLTVTSPSGTTLYRVEVGTQAMSNTSTCKGFDIPAKNIEDGNYKITIAYTSTNAHGSATYESKN